MIIVRRQHRSAVKTALIIAAIASIAIVLGVPAQAGQFQQLDVGQYGQVEFNAPSGNIGCIYIPAGGTPVYETANGGAEIQCDRVEPSYVRTILGDAGAAYRINDVGDASCCSIEQTIHYGRTVELGPFQCLSERRGLTCARADGHGFFVSRALIQVK
jgi:hypothetical protein